MWQRKLLNLVCLWIKHGESIVAHLPKPDMPLQVNDRAHESTPWLGKIIFSKSSRRMLAMIRGTCCVYGSRSTGNQESKQEQKEKCTCDDLLHYACPSKYNNKRGYSGQQKQATARVACF